MSTNKDNNDTDKMSLEASSILPGDVHSLEQLDQIPEEFLNINNPKRPLLNTDAKGRVYTYPLNPLFYSVFLILILELLERFSFYGLYMTQTNFLTGSYNDEWNANMSSMDAASLVSLSTAVAYTVPFVGGLLADSYLGDYKTILLGTAVFYLPGLLLIASSTTPNWLLGTEEFNVKAYKVALLFFWPIGTGEDLELNDWLTLFIIISHFSSLRRHSEISCQRLWCKTISSNSSTLDD
jgi:POT family proton-dependent oligopeptide transporter